MYFFCNLYSINVLCDITNPNGINESIHQFRKYVIINMHREKHINHRINYSNHIQSINLYLLYSLAKMTHTSNKTAKMSGVFLISLS